MAMAALRKRLDEGEVLLLDGATGTELERRGARMSGGAWCALATETDPDLLLEIHEDYIRAGADVITANTFSNARHMLERAGVPEKAAGLTRRAVETALKARDNAADGRDVAIAVSLSHQMPMVPGAARDDPALRPSPERALDNFREVLRAGAEAGADMAILEMMSRPIHIAPAIRAAEESGLPYWCGASARLAEGEVVSYAWESFPFEDSVRAVLRGNADVVGVMHTNVDATGPALDILKREWAGPAMAYPDSGFFEMPRWRFADVVEPDAFAAAARTWRDKGVQVFGGCCGLGPGHIAALAALKS